MKEPYDRIWLKPLGTKECTPQVPGDTLPGSQRASRGESSRVYRKPWLIYYTAFPGSILCSLGQNEDFDKLGHEMP